MFKATTIHADGVTDDLPGLRAAFGNKRVRIGGRTYRPGEPVRIEGRLALSRTIWLTDPADDDHAALQSLKAEKQGWAIVARKRSVEFAPDCRITLAGREGDVSSAIPHHAVICFQSPDDDVPVEM